ncbi:MAG: hypothetical protein KatS3mg131_3413 [Candidatus Tectimicrobiota bacterium]|nr:MAG: hypothetical protein KatS3mg131_3413 [Candidatus Tectomicrobia bacterium]
MSEALLRATAVVTAADLPHMVLARHELPPALHNFVLWREGELDNETLARQGLPGSSAARFRAVGRLTGYLREFAAPAPEPGTPLSPGTDLVAATVVHLFDDPQGVARWIEDVFLAAFEAHVDREVQPGQRLLVVRRLAFRGFADLAAGLRVLQTSPLGLVSSTIVDFRLGRLLGVAYVATLGNHERTTLVQRLGRELERKIMRVVLGDR